MNYGIGSKADYYKNRRCGIELTGACDDDFQGFSKEKNKKDDSDSKMVKKGFIRKIFQKSK